MTHKTYRNTRRRIDPEHGLRHAGPVSAPRPSPSRQINKTDGEADRVIGMRSTEHGIYMPCQSRAVLKRNTAREEFAEGLG